MPVSGHEPRFRQLYLEEAGPALDRLSRDLLALEYAQTDPALVDSLFRNAHNLKGGAAVVGLDDVQRIAHAMEDVLETLRRGRSTATGQVIDRLLTAVDALRELLPALVQGVPHAVDVDRAEAALRQPVEPAAPAASAVRGGTAGPPAAPDGTPHATAPAGHPSAPEAPSSQGTATGPGGTATGAGGTATGAGGTATGAGGTGPGGPPAAGTVTTLQMPVARLDEIVRLVGEGSGAHSRLGRYLEQRLQTAAGEIAEFRELSGLLNDLQERTTRARMVPVVAMTEPLHRVVRDLARRLGKKVRWEAAGTDTELDRSLVDQLTGPLLHLVRNAVDHGIEQPAERIAAGKPEQGTVRLHAVQIGPEAVLTITDDGRGIDLPRVRQAAGAGPTSGTVSDDDALYLVFRSGVSTADEVTEVSGRGVGLDVVRSNLDTVRGRIEVRSRPGEFTEFRITVPVTLTVLRCLVVRSGGQRYAMPLHAVVTALPPRDGEISVDGQATVWVGERTVPVCGLAETLDPDAAPEHGPAVVLAGLTRQRAFRVGELLGQRDVVVKGLSPLLPRLPVCTGASAEPDGSVLLVLDANGLIDRARATRSRRGPQAPAAAAPAAATILVVDDALTVRELQRSILQRAGYTVHLARDGVEALELAATMPIDLVVTDLEMPRMDGLELTRRLRADPKRSGVGILVLTSLGDEQDRRRGMEAGADGYLVKNQFDESRLLTAVHQVLGEPT